jgi:hypothetical protein
MPVSFFKTMKPTRAARMAVLFFVLIAARFSANALTITNVTPVNVTPSSFTLLWQTGEPATPSVSIFSDAAGTTNLAGQLAIETFPLHSGNPQLTDAYKRRQNRAALRNKTKSFGMMQVKVSGCRPGTTYYFRVQATGTNGQQIVFPDSGALPSVTTAVENSFVAESKQLLIEVPGNDVEGMVLTLSNTNASHALSAVVGDGAGTNQVFFSLSDLFALIGGTNFTPVGNQEFTAELLGTSSRNPTQRYTLAFTGGFNVGGSEFQPFTGDFLEVLLGTSILQTGSTGHISIGVVAGGAVTNTAFALDLPANRFSNVALQTVNSEFAGSTLQNISSGRYLLTLRSSAGQFLQGTQANLVQLNFTAITNQPSAIVQVLPQNFTVSRADGSALTNLLAQQGKIVMIGAEPILESSLVSAQGRALTVYGIPGLSYGIQSSTNLAQNNWTHVMRVPMTNLFKVFSEMDTNQATIFYRAYEFKADPPLLEAQMSSNQTRGLVIYGKAGTQYELQSSSSLSGPVTWNPLLTVTLTNSFGSVENLGTNGNLFYRLKVQ